MTARALVLAAIADGPSTLHAPLRARDTELMAAGLRALGLQVSTQDETGGWSGQARCAAPPTSTSVSPVR